MTRVHKKCSYSELQVTSNFSFLRGASHPEELITCAAKLGHQAIALTDHNTLSGIVRAHLAKKELGQEHDIQFIVGCQIELTIDRDSDDRDSDEKIQLLAYPLSLRGYASLCTLLTQGRKYEKRRHEQEQFTTNDFLLELNDFLEIQRELALIIVPTRPHAPYNHLLNRYLYALDLATRTLRATLSKDVLLSIALTKLYSPFDRFYLTHISAYAHKNDIPLIVTNDVHYHIPQRRALQDILTCIRHRCTIQEAGYKLFSNTERHLKSSREMLRLFSDFPDAVKRTALYTEATSNFSLDQLKYEYPREVCPTGESDLSYLHDLTWKAVNARYPEGAPNKIAKLLEHEFKVIKELNYAKYFLTCYDIVAFAKSRSILCQGRGAAANSAICYFLGITAVDPEQSSMLFERFVSKERNEPPDIDIDFEHERREEVIQYIYNKYGRDRAALTAEVVCYRPRSAIREVSKALGLSLEIADQLAKATHHWTEHQISPEQLATLGLSSSDPTINNAITLSKELLGFPRHLSQHVGGFIISNSPLSDTIPIRNAAMENRTIIEWDKYDIEALGMLKIDILALGMLTCIRKAFALINTQRSKVNKSLFDMQTLPPEDPKVYDMICSADTIGVFQIESRAQMSMLPRLRPRCFYDLVIEVAIVRPGPIQGNMVHPYLKRRNGIEQVQYPDKKIKDILGRTLGIPLFQEQAMELAVATAGFTPGEAERLRRSMAAWKRSGKVIERFQEQIVCGMMQNGYTREFSENCFEQIKGFGEYGFPESHAASFALLVYSSAWIKKHYPAEFAAALINSQPMGFYHVEQIVSDARKHAVEIRPIDINASNWDCTLEDSSNNRRALRLGLRLIKGLSHKQAEIIIQLREHYGMFNDLMEAWQTLSAYGLRKNTLTLLAKADALNSLQLSAQAALWQIKGLPDTILPLDRLSPDTTRTDNMQLSFLPKESISQKMWRDYEATELSLRAHPFSFIRPYLDPTQIDTAQSLKQDSFTTRNNRISVAGRVLFRQRPRTAKGTVFLTIEDETAVANLILRSHVFKQYTDIALHSSWIIAHGTLQRSESVVYVSVQRLEDLQTRGLSEAFTREAFTRDTAPIKYTRYKYT